VLKTVFRSGGLAFAGFLGGMLLSACGALPAETAGADVTMTREEATVTTVLGTAQDTVGDLPVLRVGGLETSSLDPAFVKTETEAEIASLVFRPLVGLDRLSHPVAGAALGWKTDDNREWTFDLDPQGRFHNGEPVTAGSFVAAMMFLANPDNGCPNAYLGVDARIEGFEDMARGDADTISGLEVSDALTLTIRLTEPNALLPSMLAHMAFAPRSEAALSDGEMAALQPIGNGPFTISEPWDGASPVSLNPVGSAAFAIRFEFFDSVESMFVDRTLDVSHVPVDQFEALRAASSRDRIIDRSVGAYNYLAFPMDHAPFDNPEVRRALSLAIDREALVEQVFANGKKPAVGFAPSGSLGSTPGDCTSCVYDPDLARQLIEDAGGFDDDAIELAFNTDRNHEEWVQAVGAQWAEVFGIEVRFKPDGTVPYFEAIESGAHTGPYRLGWSVDFAHAMSFLEPLFVGEDNSTLGYRSFAIDTISSRLMEIDDPYSEDGAALVSLMTARLNKDMPIIPVFAHIGARVLSDQVSEVQLNLDGSVRLEDAILSR
jgi:ABC-type oligopeptide transport system substrate-binding subunit